MICWGFGRLKILIILGEIYFIKLLLPRMKLLCVYCTNSMIEYLFHKMDSNLFKHHERVWIFWLLLIKIASLHFNFSSPVNTLKIDLKSYPEYNNIPSFLFTGITLENDWNLVYMRECLVFIIVLRMRWRQRKREKMNMKEQNSMTKIKMKKILCHFNFQLELWPALIFFFI